MLPLSMAKFLHKNVCFHLARHKKTDENHIGFWGS